ncbi:MAG: hydrogenase small subunit [Desulfobulbaceae bacterium]|nr:hydrogenase small subunit [Desulfobulbaceae bacterium]
MLDRREFVKVAATLSTAFGISNLPEPVRAALKKIDPATIPKLIYLQGQSCTGCSISLLQAESPSPLTMITDYSQLSFHADLSATSGKQSLELIEKFISGNAGDYILAVEGAIPEDMPEACVIGERTFASYLEEAAHTMTAAVAIGSCACDGGIPAAEGNQTGAVGLQDFYSKRNIEKIVVNIRGCSVHPDWVWHTIVQLVKIGLPQLTEEGSPNLFYSRTIHETCPRYHDFQQEIFAKKLGDRGCLFKLGCLGPQTKADCSTRWWNGGCTWCIDANAPCIGCASPTFARKKDFSFYRINKKG